MNAMRPLGFFLAAAAAVVLGAGYLLPHPAPATGGAPSVQSTVPPALSVADPQPNATPLPGQNAAAPSVVYVCGAVKRPGIYRLAPGARLADAVAQAGGALGNADLEQLNLAQPVVDGMKIDVPGKGHSLAETGAESLAGDVSQPRSPHRGGHNRHKLQPGQTLNINTATQTELTQLPGVGPGLARRIVEYRTANGPFQTIDDLQNVSGIGPSKFAKLAPYVRL
jgi:competence protein ComEA